MCPQFERMKAIFGEKANVTPSATLELGVPSGASDGGDSDSSETLAARYDDEWGDNDELTYVPSALSPFLPLKSTSLPGACALRVSRVDKNTVVV
ncbi:hypothetical protein PC128_g20112 [Phytophthora cactorum]|uniref:Uncharacterized protein n=2 Tax=Phytophthora cactorum TaxID=29920 RepID=A0A8T1AAT9_9STRA|nr:hypothetical protein PC115_g24325 [Phytophthora cactorum]KAG3164563.1 hypothetical protein PC128_g20112 [Phytophthora cactorum]